MQHAYNTTRSSLFLLFTIDDHGSRPEPGTLPLHTQIWVSVVLARTTHTHTTHTHKYGRSSSQHVRAFFNTHAPPFLGTAVSAVSVCTLGLSLLTGHT